MGFSTFGREAAPTELKDDEVEEDLSDIEKHEAKATKKANYRGLYRVTQYVWTNSFEAENLDDAFEGVDQIGIDEEEYMQHEREFELVEIENVDTGEVEPA